MTAAVDVVVGILLRDGKILLCRRKPGSRYALKWEFPGGKVEPGETHEAALARELREEINVLPLRQRLLRADRNTYPDGGLFDVLYYIVDAFDGEPENRDCHETAWVLPAEFDNYDILDGNRPVCRLLQEHLSGTTHHV